jgi:hypothetical protein
MWFLLTLLTILNVIDGIQTVKGINRGLTEINPVGRFLFDRVGLIPGLIAFKAAILGGAATAAYTLPYWYASALLVPLILWGAYTVITNQMELD